MTAGVAVIAAGADELQLQVALAVDGYLIQYEHAKLTELAARQYVVSYLNLFL